MRISKQEDFMRLYEPVHERFERFCRARVYGEMHYKDLMNETICVAYEKYHGIKNEKSFLQFLFGIAVRILANANRKMKPYARDEQDLLYVEDQNSRTDSCTEVRILHEALAKLPADQKEALVLFEITGFSIKEIAEIQEASQSAVKKRLSRGRRRLAELLTTVNPEVKS